MKIVKPSVDLLSCTANSAEIIELAGRTCYKSEDKITETSASKFVEMINKRNHVSVIEHASATFRFVTDRGITHEIVRHRIASYSQESTRYCNYSRDKFGVEISVVKPSQLDDTSLAYQDWLEVMLHAEACYLSMLDAGCKPQTARAVLPTCLKTEIVMTANFREWSHFITLRMAPAAHPDIRPLAFAVYQKLRELCPAVFSTEHFTDLAKSFE